MKVCSFIPAVTRMIYDMGIQDQLYGVTFECPETALEEKPKVVRCILEGKNYTSREIDRIFSASKAEGKSLYYVDEKLLGQIAPDVIFTQDVCKVCQIDTACTAAAIAKLEKQPKLISITPQSLTDVFDSAVTIAEIAGQEENAYQYLRRLRARIDQVIDKLREKRALPRRTMVMEWIDPVYNCGHWIPHQVAYAGGTDMLGNPGGDSIVIPWEKVVKYDPEVLVIAPCGFTTARSVEEMSLLSKRHEWEKLSAVKNNEVYIADYDLFTQPSPSTLAEGIELLAGLFHPEIFEIPERLKAKCIKWKREFIGKSGIQIRR